MIVNMYLYLNICHCLMKFEPRLFCSEGLYKVTQPKKQTVSLSLRVLNIDIQTHIQLVTSHRSPDTNHGAPGISPE